MNFRKSVSWGIRRDKSERWLPNLKVNTSAVNWQETCDILDRAAKKIRDGKKLPDGFIPSENLTPEETDLIGLHGYRRRGDGVIVRMNRVEIVEWTKRHWMDERFTDKLEDENPEIL